MYLVGLKPSPSDPVFLQCFDTVGWVIKTRPGYDLWCVWWDIKLYSTSASVTSLLTCCCQHSQTLVLGCIMHNAYTCGISYYEYVENVFIAEII